MSNATIAQYLGRSIIEVAYGASVVYALCSGVIAIAVPFCIPDILSLWQAAIIFGCGASILMWLYLGVASAPLRWEC